MDLMRWMVSPNGGAYEDEHTIPISGVTCLSIACHAGHLNIAQYCHQQCPQHLHFADVKGFTPLYAAASAGHVSIVKWLLTVSDDEEVQTKVQKDAVEQAVLVLVHECPRNGVECAELLLNSLKFPIFQTRAQRSELMHQWKTVQCRTHHLVSEVSRMLIFLIKKGYSHRNDICRLLFQVPEHLRSELLVFAKKKVDNVEKYLQFLLVMRNHRVYEFVDRIAFRHVRESVRSYLIDEDIMRDGVLLTLRAVINYETLFAAGNIVISSRDICGQELNHENRLVNINPLKSWLQTDIVGRLTTTFEHPEIEHLLKSLLSDIPTLPAVFETVCAAYRLNNDFLQQGGRVNWWNYLFEIYIDDVQLHNQMMCGISETFVDQVFRHGGGEEGRWTAEYLRRRGYRIEVL
jgi:hypothetical protein